VNEKQQSVRPAQGKPFQMSFSFLVIGAVVIIAILALAAVLIFVSRVGHK
jgi:hypothetical protein